MPFSYLGVFFLSVVLSALLTPPTAKLAIRLGAVSRPGGRNINGQMTPRLGGLAIFIAFCLALFALMQLETRVSAEISSNSTRTIGLFLGGILMLAIGFFDDVRGIRAKYKLLAQFVAALIAYACLYRIDVVHLPFIGNVDMGLFGLPLTVLWIVGVVNAINLIDGLDGLAGGVVFFAAITNFVVAYLSDSIFVATIMVGTLGSVLGFLFFNFNPARIFMGDSGSYFLGYVLALTAVAAPFQKASTAISLLVPIVALGVPIIDTLFAMLRRILEHRPLFSPDQGHIHHRLLSMGITHRRAVLIIYAVSILLTLSAIAIALGRNWEIGVAMLAVSIILFGLVRLAGFFEYITMLRQRYARVQGEHVELLRRQLPTLPGKFAAITAETQLWMVLETVVKECKLDHVEINELATTTMTAPLRIAGSPLMEVRSGHQMWVRYPIGSKETAVAEFCFAWTSEASDELSQCTILLQIIVDMVEQTLGRMNSRLAPRAAA